MKFSLLLAVSLLFIAKCYSQDNYFKFGGATDVFFRCLSQGTGGRAITHDHNNVLTLNYGNDFTGGVRVHSRLAIDDESIIPLAPRAFLDCNNLSSNTLKSVLARLPEGNNEGEGTYLGVKSYFSQKTPEYPDGKIKLFSIEHKFYGQLNSSIDFFRGGGVQGGYIGINVHNGHQIGKFHIDGLDIAGTIKAREIKVEVDAGADHVFNNNYDLKPLSEVETFVKENKHLPEIPSEKHMQENGLNMNEFQIKLLQKIEELTLYVIDLKKENLEQNKLIEDLQERLESR